MTSLANFSARAIDGTQVDLATYVGDVVLVVNTASKCGHTPQFEGLQELSDRYSDKGFTVLGFPCDQFANQELGTDEEIASFCQRNYGVSFPMFSKVDVNGDLAHPLWVWLKEQRSGRSTPDIKWNFTKFLLGRDGQVLNRYRADTEPVELAPDIEDALAD